MAINFIFVTYSINNIVKGISTPPLTLWKRVRVRVMFDFKSLIPTFSQREKEFFEFLEIP
ncbi:hypothetical protein [Methyloglobulus sp.]|uniref:hypothetical protein n=1 Tax=Methyloglobulus sp. TaxID=2518622 RepID=UPI0032B711A8